MFNLCIMYLLVHDELERNKAPVEVLLSTEFFRIRLQIEKLVDNGLSGSRNL